jgi:hypothetical protein
MKGTIPSPNIGFKKLLNKRFDIVEINEYNTSKLYNKTFKEQLLTKSKVLEESDGIKYIYHYNTLKKAHYLEFRNSLL